ncbi:hypothetical protein LCGC14_0793020 [marine sediment metagenome]|uniref:Uncharacterized protein n=1 Tax=marine sediment metagenome TaxID=412755 RepID=A0A0F9QBU4_9ZZZZ
MKQPSQREQHLQADADSARQQSLNMTAEARREKAEADRLRAVNAKLLKALEQATLFIEGVFPKPSPLLKQDLAFYRDLIEQAIK